MLGLNLLRISSLQFCFFKSWKVIRKLLETVNNVDKYSDYKISNILYFEIFSLLSCFDVPKQFEKWRQSQHDIITKKADDSENDLPKKKKSVKERKSAAKREEEAARKEFVKTQRIIKETVRMLGGYVHSTESPSPEPNGKDSDDEDEEKEEKEEEEEDESFNRDIILKFLFECLAKQEFVIGAITAIGKLCKIKHNGNMKRLDQMIEIMKRENVNQYQLSVKGFKERLNNKY